MNRKHFNLHLHRTEVVKRPATARNPVMPSKHKYYYSNYNIEGIEKKNSDLECLPLSDYSADMPPADLADEDLATDEVILSTDYYEFDLHHRVASDGRVIPIDPGTGKWLRKPRNVLQAAWDSTPSMRIIMKAA